MKKYILKRVLQMIPVMFLVSVIIFFVMRALPGDPVSLMLAGAEGGAITPERRAQLVEQMGLNDPIFVQYWNWITAAVRGDLGESIRMRQPVTALICQFFASTFKLSLAGLVFSLIVGLSTGIIAALKKDSWVDFLMMLLSYIGISMPVFWLGLVFILIFSFRLKWFPSAGGEGFKALILPGLTLGLASAGLVSRLTRSSLIEILNEDYIRTARSKGNKESRILYHHALKNSLIQVITIVGLQFGSMMAGACVTETVFSRPGLGRILVNGVLWMDYPLVQGIVLFLALIYMTTNLIVDISYAFIDPRIRFS